MFLSFSLPLVCVMAEGSRVYSSGLWTGHHSVTGRATMTHTSRGALWLFGRQQPPMMKGHTERPELERKQEHCYDQGVCLGQG